MLPSPAADDWSGLDQWWESFEADHSLSSTPAHSKPLCKTDRTEEWETVDEFWDSFAGQQQAQLEILRGLMRELRTTWDGGASHFEDDPLTTNWRLESQYEGPLRANIDEEDWSQWLAHLLRTSTGPFLDTLLGMPGRSADGVRREIVFSDGDSTRRIDILVEYADTAVSIEVKTGDENVGKTPETAGLIESNDTRDWSHFLLLQKSNRHRLERAFGERLNGTDADLRIESEQDPDIDVLYWQDVSRVLRRMLLEGREPDSHWQASAYLFVTLIEQRLLKFHSFAFIGPTTEAGATDIQRLVAIEPAAQIDYLRAILQETETHE